MRKARKNTATRQIIHIVGEGLTELFYFSHLKKVLGYRYSISPRLFENNSIEKIEKKIKELLDEDVFVICVFDADVSRRSDAENKKMVSLKKKYENNANVILCDSLQSIEYWFLLHFEDTCRHFQDSAATERALKQYLPTYDKTRKYLEKDKWVKEILAGSKMDKACELAESLSIPNLVLWHTEDKNLSHRKELYTAEGKEYYHGNLLVPDDGEIIKL